MGFKLGTERGNYAVSGEIRTKMRFHQEAGGDASVVCFIGESAPIPKFLFIGDPFILNGPLICLCLLSYHL